MGVLACPACSVKLKIPEGKSGRFNCPKCGKSLSIPAPRGAAAPAPGRPIGGGASPPSARPAQTEPHQLLSTDLLSAHSPLDSLPPRPLEMPTAGLMSTSIPAWSKQPTAQRTASPLKTFLMRLGIGIGILSGVLLVLGAVGTISEPIALGTCFIGILAAVALVVGGRLWLIVMAFQESVVQGLLVLLVPYYWIVYPAIRKGRALQPLALIISALAPVLVCLAMLTLFFPHYQDGMSFDRPLHPGLSGAQVATIEAQIRESQTTSPNAQVLRTVSFPTFEQIGGPIDPARAEQVLAELPGYVRGSFRFNAPQRVVAFQYRGDEDLASRFGLVLAAKAKIFIGLQPTFRDGSLPPAVNALAANPPAGDPFQALATPPVPVVDTAAAVISESTELKTVSFQTLGQGNVNPAAAEQALTPLAGYVPGSFRFDLQNQQATLQYHGTEAAALQFGSALQQKLGMMVRLRPMFVDGSFPSDPSQ